MVTLPPVWADMKSKTVLSFCQSRKFSVEMPLRSPLRRLLEHAHDAVGLFVGQRLQENPVHEAENGDVGAHADGQRQHRNRGKPAAVLQGACGVAQILTEGHRSASWGRS